MSKKWIDILDSNIVNGIIYKLNPEIICPKENDIFKAFKLCSLDNCKVIFLAQDPYPQEGVATGLAFGNNTTNESKISPSLKVLKEAIIDYSQHHNYPIIFDNTLESLAKQGILLLNSALTTEINKVGSHIMLWRPFIINVIESLCKYDKGYLFVLFGKQAQTFKPYINKYQKIIEVNHPAYYCRTHKIMPSDVFIEINKYLLDNYNYRIKWYEEGECKD